MANQPPGFVQNDQVIIFLDNPFLEIPRVHQGSIFALRGMKGFFYHNFIETIIAISVPFATYFNIGYGVYDPSLQPQIFSDGSGHVCSRAMAIDKIK
jgi:hypothetical protein